MFSENTSTLKFKKNKTQVAPWSSDVTTHSRTARQEIPPPYVKPEGSLPLKPPATGTYPEPDESNSRTLFVLLCNPIPEKTMITSHNEGDVKTNTGQLCSKTTIHITDVQS